MVTRSVFWVLRAASSIAAVSFASVSVCADAARPGEPAPSAPSEPAVEPAPPEPPKPAVEPGPSVEPGLHHAPVSVAAAGAPLAIAASIDHPELVKSALLVYRAAGDETLREVPFARASSGPYIAIVPPTHVRSPSLRYMVELETTRGERRAVFGARDDMQEVEVPVDREDSRERYDAERLDGRRSVVASSAEYVVFGARGGVAGTDRYWRTEAGYTYRPLRWIAEFGIRAGVVRGPNPEPGKAELGLNYGAPSVRLRLGDHWHLEGEFLTSVTDVGFSVGAGCALWIGDPYGSKLVLGAESIQLFGTRFYSRLDLAARRGLTISPIVEVTDMPHANRYGVRLLTEARFNVVEGVKLGVRGGYQARVASSGGPAIGVSAEYAF